MDNERPIEKLLRRYAKKRRDEAGTQGSMHPATRQMLQGEVATQFRKERIEQTSKTSFIWWPRLAYGLAVVAALAVAAGILVPVLTRHESPSLEIASTSRSRENELSGRTFGEEKDSFLASRETAGNDALRVASDERSKLAGGLEDSSATITNESVLTYADARQSVNGLSLVTAEEDNLRGVGTASPAAMPPSALDREPTSRKPVASPPSTLPQGQAAAAAVSKAVGDGRDDSYGLSPARGRFSNTDKAGSKGAVLVSFQVEQAGDELRVIDSDGSTYAGRIVAALDQMATERDSVKKNKEESPATLAPARGAFDSTSRIDSSAQNAFFRVSGTNKTLKQQVIFTGNFVAVTNAFQAQLLNSTDSKQAQTLSVQQAFPLQLNNSIIVGRAQLERNVEVEINAVPVSH
jgi:hypothetical protein